MLRISNVAKLSFNAIFENKFLANRSEFTVSFCFVTFLFAIKLITSKVSLGALISSILANTWVIVENSYQLRDHVAYQPNLVIGII